MKRKIVALLTTLALTFSLAACGNSETTNDESTTTDETTEETTEESTEGDTEAAESGNYKDTLNIAVDVEAPTLDTHISAATAARHVACCIYEGIFECDENFQPQMQLLSDYSTEDNKTWKFTLREGVKFHDGSELTAEDAVASLNRWIKLNPNSSKFVKNGEEFAVTGDYTFEIVLQEAVAMLPYILAAPTQFPIITTKEICEKYPDAQFQEYIGTGPCKFVDWTPNSVIHLEKFDEYVGPGYEHSAWSGDKELNYQDVYFYTVSDITTRVTGLQSGEYDMIENVSAEYKTVLDSDANCEVQGFDRAVAVLQFNMQDGADSPTQDTNVRKAVQMVTNVDDLGAANSSDPSFYGIDGSIMPSTTSWYVETENNFNNAEEAKKLVEASGYNGEEIKILTTQSYPQYYDICLVLEQEMESVGLNVTVEAVDWATLLSTINSNDPNADWDMFYMIWPTVSNPISQTMLATSYIGGEYQTTLGGYWTKINSAATTEEANEVWKEAAKYISDEALVYKLWDVKTYVGHSTKMKDLSVTIEYSIFGSYIEE